MIPLAQINKLSTNHSSTTKSHNMDVNAEFGRLIHAAVINKSFRSNLLKNPAGCIDAGYCGESFHFPVEIKNRIKQINARSLEEFSSQIIKLINMPSVPEMAPVFCN
ncbi:MAG: hypothetical protein K0B14_09295 [Anaerolineaceae bacterium]|nr:hypothetical protein [Anaerolineaceae bacterium]